jgi:hypothetical protein
MLASLFTLGIYLMGHLTRDLVQIGERSESENLRRATKVIYEVLPDLESFNRTLEAVHQLPIEPSQIGWPIVYGAGYTIAILFAAAFVFERRDFR